MSVYYLYKKYGYICIVCIRYDAVTSCGVCVCVCVCVCIHVASISSTSCTCRSNMTDLLPLSTMLFSIV